MARSIRVGLVIDCTALDLEEFEPLPVSKATNNNASSSSSKFDRRVRYFHNPSEWDDYDVEYHRLLPPKDDDNDGTTTTGSSDPFAPQTLSEFYSTVSKFLQKSRANDTTNNTMTHIALFDSRGGLGAAAYLAAAYMCHSLKAPVHVAIEALKEGTPLQSGDGGRKWGLCDVRLVKDLQMRFKGRKEIVIEGGNPNWWWAVEDEDEDEEDDDDDKNGQSERKRKREEAIIIPACDLPTTDEDGEAKRAKQNGNDTTSIFPDLPIDILNPVQQDDTKWKRAMTVLSQMTTLPTSSSNPSDPKTISTLPLKSEVDISNGNTETDIIQLIKNNPEKYKVTWLSTNGRRGLLLILSEAVYFIEQTTSSSNISISIVTNIKFPSPKDLSKGQHRTLLDVVLVKDFEKNKPTYRFYALDILCIEGGMVFHKPWDQRWRYLNDGVLIPRKKDESMQQAVHVYAKEQIKIRAKEYFPMKKLGFVMKDVCAGVGHEAEGVRVVSTGEYGSSVAVIWRRRGCTVSDEQLKSLLLAE